MENLIFSDRHEQEMGEQRRIKLFDFSENEITHVCVLCFILLPCLIFFAKFFALTLGVKFKTLLHLTFMQHKKKVFLI